MNESDTDANTKAVDSLLNYETVKYFGAEEREARRYDRSMEQYERASIKTYTSLAVLNLGQAVVFTLALTGCMAMAAMDVVSGHNTVGQFIMVNALMLQLFIPLNFMGMVYREIKQGIIDIERMMDVLEMNPEVADKPGAKPLRGERRQRALRERDVPLRAAAADPGAAVVRGAGGQDGGHRRAVGGRQIDHQPHPAAVLRCGVGVAC